MKIKGYVQTDRVGSRTEFEVPLPDDYFDGMSETEKQACIESHAMEAMFEKIEWGYEIEE